jgi:hypothetical protein
MAGLGAIGTSPHARMRSAWHAGGEPGPFFEHWLNAGNGYTWGTGLSEVSTSVDALRERLNR